MTESERERGKRGKLETLKVERSKLKREREKKDVRARDEDEDLCLDRSSSLSSANLLLLLSVIVFFFVKLYLIIGVSSPLHFKKKKIQDSLSLWFWSGFDTSLNVSVHLQYLLIFFLEKN